MATLIRTLKRLFRADDTFSSAMEFCAFGM